MERNAKGFTLIELIAVIIVISIMSVTLFSRLGSVSNANVQAGRDDLIAALFFAQQTAMSRSGITLLLTASSVSVRENGTPLVVHSKGYPLSFASGVTATAAPGGVPLTLTYDKLGRIATKTTITLSGPSSTTAVVTVEASGYAH